MYSDALSNDILKRFIRPAFQKLPLLYCVSTTDLYAAIGTQQRWMARISSGTFSDPEMLSEGSVISFV